MNSYADCAESRTHFKITDSETSKNYRFSLPAPLLATFAEFKSRCAAIGTETRFQRNDTTVALWYIDEDGDRIEVECDGDLSEAITLAKPRVTVHLFMKKGVRQKQQQQRPHHHRPLYSGLLRDPETMTVAEIRAELMYPTRPPRF
jgi:hypothetical protein